MGRGRRGRRWGLPAARPSRGFIFTDLTKEESFPSCEGSYQEPAKKSVAETIGLTLGEIVPSAGPLVKLEGLHFAVSRVNNIETYNSTSIINSFQVDVENLLAVGGFIVKNIVMVKVILDS